MSDPSDMEHNLSIMLKSFKSNTLCFICKEVTVRPVKYQKCQHFFCEECLAKSSIKTNCPQCGVNNKDSIVPDRIIDKFANSWYNICQKMGLEKDETVKMDERRNTEGREKLDDLVTGKCMTKTPQIRGKSKKKKKAPLNISHSKLDENPSKLAKSHKATDVTMKDGSSTDLNDTRNTNDSNETKTFNKPTYFLNTFSDSSKVENNKENVKTLKKPSTSSMNQSNSNSSLHERTNTFGFNEKNMQKRNNKGETPLHIACTKGNSERLKLLLSLGAKPNTKDNAGWTPLQEAADKGDEEIVKILLDNGAIPDMPGFENSTPLLMAVNNNHLNIVKMLLEHGCNKEARNIYNQTPESLCKTSEMKDMLNNTNFNEPSISLSQNIMFVDDIAPSKIIFYIPDLHPTNIEKLADIINAPNSNVTRGFKMDRTITHIMVETNLEGTCKLSVPVLLGMLTGRWIISEKWIDSQNRFTGAMEMEKFEVKGTSSFPHSNAAKRARISYMNQLPGLFNGCYFYFWGPPTDVKMDDLIISRHHLKLFVEYGGGTLLKREPNPELIPESEKTSPYHAKATSVLKKCSHYIIYRPDIQEPVLKYNMPHIKSLPLQWMINCIENFKIMDPYF